MPRCSSRVAVAAFSLTELLVSLGIVGLLAALTGPGIMNNVQLARQKAVYKETFSAISLILKSGVDTGEIGSNNTNGLVALMDAKLNAPSKCLAAATTGAPSCMYTMDGDGHYLAPYFDRWTLQNGAAFGIRRGVNVAVHEAFIDVNGSQPPNIRDQDMIYLLYNASSENNANFTPYYGYPFKGGTFLPHAHPDATDLAWHEAMMKS